MKCPECGGFPRAPLTVAGSQHGARKCGNSFHSARQVWTCPCGATNDGRDICGGCGAPITCPQCAHAFGRHLPTCPHFRCNAAPLPDGGERLAAREAVLHAASIFHPQKDAQLVEALHNAAALLTESSAPLMTQDEMREVLENSSQSWRPRTESSAQRPNPECATCKGCAAGSQSIYDHTCKTAERMRARNPHAPTPESSAPASGGVREALEGLCAVEIHGVAYLREDDVLAALSSAPTRETESGLGPLYPCEKCGKLRTKAEGGTTFTVCDTCWDAAFPRPDGGGRTDA